ncbi:MAG: hypothetical protein ABI844_14230 [Saprospiraceae bacterium]
MKKRWRISLFLIIGFFQISLVLRSQDTAQLAVRLSVQFRSEADRSMNIMATAVAKINSRLSTVPGLLIKFYLDEESENNLIGASHTDSNGKADVSIPASLLSKWNESDKHTLIASSKDTLHFSSSSNDITVGKCKIVIDTLGGSEKHRIQITALAKSNDTWIPIKDMEILIGVKRLAGSVLKFTEDGSFTTDSSGKVVVELTDTFIKGDENGKIILLAKCEDNDDFGTVISEKEVHWGKKVGLKSDFFQNRTLWSTRFRTPIWLLVLVYGMSIGIWATIFYVFRQIYKIKKAGQVIN